MPEALSGEDKDPKDDAGIKGTVDLLKRYVMQETLGPLKQIGRILGYGIGGALSLAVGLVLLIVAVLRVLQEDTGRFFAGHWNWVPYVVAGLLSIGLLGLAVLAATRRAGGDSQVPA